MQLPVPPCRRTLRASRALESEFLTIPVLLVALLAASSLLQDRRPVPLSTEASTGIRGRILDPEGAPLGGRKVLLRPIVAAALAELPPLSCTFAAPPLDLPFQDTTTAADGSFGFSPIAAGASCFLSVDSGASGLQVRTIEAGGERAPETGITWKLDSGLRVHGLVVDADSGAPIDGARIRVTTGCLEGGGLDPEKLAAGNGLLYDNSSAGSVWIPPPWLSDLLLRGAALEEPSASATCRTAADGSFDLSVVKSKLAFDRLRVTAADHAEVEQELEVGPQGDVGTIRLPKLVPVRVRVVDERGEPLPGARVRVACGFEGKEYASAGSEPPRQNPLALGSEIRTDGNGEAEIRLAPQAPAWIAVLAAQRADWIPTKVESRTGTIELRVPAALALSVRTEAADGQPVDAEIACIHLADVGPCSGLDAMLPIVVPETRDPGPMRATRGSATITGLARGMHIVVARAPGFEAACAEAHLESSAASLAIRLTPLRPKTLRILGRIEGAERPLDGVRVAWVSNSPEEAGFAIVLPGRGVLETDEEGRIEIPCAAGSRLQLSVAADGFAAGSFEVEPDQGSATFVLCPGGSLVGRVRLSEKPIPERIVVTLEKKDDARASFGGITAVAEPPDGRFRFDDVEPGTYELSAGFLSGLRDPEPERTVVIAEGESTEVDIVLEATRKKPSHPAPDEGGPVTAVVVGGATNEPLAEANVWLVAAAGDDSDPKSYRFSSSRRAFDDGKLEWPSVPAGTYWLRIFAADLVWHYSKFEVEPGKPLDLGRIVLAEGPPVAGSVVADGAAVPLGLRFKYTILPTDRPPDFWLDYYASYALVDEKTGRFETRELGPGRYVVTVEEALGDALDYRPFEIEVPAAGITNLQLRFQPK